MPGIADVAYKVTALSPDPQAARPSAVNQTSCHQLADDQLELCVIASVAEPGGLIAGELSGQRCPGGIKSEAGTHRVRAEPVVGDDTFRSESGAGAFTVRIDQSRVVELDLGKGLGTHHVGVIRAQHAHQSTAERDVDQSFLMHAR